MSDYTDSKINLVINKLTKQQYFDLKDSGEIKEDQLYMITDDHGGVSADTRYNLDSKTLQDGTVTLSGTQTDILSCQVEDLTITTIQVSSDAKPVFIYFPEIPDEGARDFCVRIECLSSSIPSISFLGYGSEQCDFESTDDSWATLEIGVNLFNFTETKR